MEFVLDLQKQSVVYIPVIEILQALLNKDKIMDKALSVEDYDMHGYSSFRKVSRFKEVVLLIEEHFRIALGLYIDEFDVANPLGTSKKKQKICAVYWVYIYANTADKLHSTQYS